MIRLKTENWSTGSVLFYLPAGHYSRLIVRMSGTNATGQTLGETDLGRITITHHNEEIFNITPYELIHRANLVEGYPESSSSAGSSFAYSVPVPFRVKKDNKNSLPVVANSTYFALQNYNTSKVSSGTIEVYGVYGEPYNLYVPVIKDKAYSPTASGTYIDVLPQINIAELYLRHDANFGDLQVKRDGTTIVQGSETAIKAFSQLINNVESTEALVDIVSPRTDVLSENFNRYTELTFEVNAGGTYTFSYVAVLPYAKR